MATSSCRVALALVLSTLALGGARAEEGWSPLGRPAALVFEAEDTLVLEGVRWGFRAGDLHPEFKRTTLRPDLVRDVYFLSENFPPEWLAAHGMLAFVFASPEGVVAADGARDIGLVLSVEARAKAGQPYSLIKGLGKTFRLIYQLCTFSDRIQSAVGMQGHSLGMSRLALTQEQKVQLLRNVCKASAEPRDHVWYNTLSESCCTNAVKMINTVLPAERQVPLWWIPGRLTNLRVSLPKLTPGYLRRRGVAEESHQIKSDASRLDFPVEGGPTFVIDVAALRERGGARDDDIAPFARELEDYLALAAALDSLRRRGARQAPASFDDLAGGGAPDAAAAVEPGQEEHPRERRATQALLDESFAALERLLSEHFEARLRFYLTLDVEPSPPIERLEAALLERISRQGGTSGDAFTDLNLQQARSTLVGR